MSDDLVSLGMRADERRSRLHPEGVVTYSTEEGGDGGLCLTPRWHPGMTGVEYLASVARTRLESETAHLGVDWRRTGLKVAQLALHFGANDFGNAGDREEDIRRIIRDAGFLPKRRDPEFRLLYVR